MTTAVPRTLFEKIWERHKIVERDDGEVLLYVDRHLIHDGSRRAFELLAERGSTQAGGSGSVTSPIPRRAPWSRQSPATRPSTR